ATTQSHYEANSIDYAIENGDTNILTLGVVIVEVPLSYAYNFTIPSGELSVGGSAKIMQGRSFFKTQRVDNKDDDSDNAQNEITTSTNFGMDLGLLYVSSDIKGLRAGMMLKNFNSPSFETVKGFGDVTLDPMARIGVSYLILENLEVAADLDLTENEMIDDVTRSRMFGVGIGWQAVEWFNLSGGFMKNTSNSDEGLIYTAGFGLGPKAFHFDLAAQMSGQQNSYEGQSVPAYANIMLSLNSQW
ncbi:MAG: conjugal transfer protein TraF, partial [Campylobacterota bacterium]|nr:conjugal transfer protein TraF [Campylobacterota bacterium]